MERLRVRVHAADGAVRDRMARQLRQAGLEPAPDGDRSPGQVVLLAAGTAGDALGGCPAPRRADGRRLVLAADVFGSADVRRAVRLGVRVMIRSDRASAAQLADAVHAARYGDGRIPYQVLTRVLGGPARLAGAEPSPWPLTARQTAVLALMAEGHANGAIAAALACSEHTVKNVIYELMARLHVRNRADAVARAVRAGLI